MNINEQIDELGQLGSVGYAASDAVVDQLHARAKRARSIRHGSAALVGSVSAVVLGVLGAQFLVDFEVDDPGFRDRNLIENNFDGTDDSAFGKDDGTKDEYLKEIYDELRVAAKIQIEELAEKEAAAAKAAEEAAAKAAKEAKEAADKDSNSTPKDEGGGGSSSCEPYDYGYKYNDCDPDEKVYRISDGEYWDDFDWVARTCGDNPHPNIAYDCGKGEWVPAIGYVYFKGEVLECVDFYDEASGTWSVGAYNVGYGKLAQCSKTDNQVYGYQYIGDLWSSIGGGDYKCTGGLKNKYGTTVRWSCIPEGEHPVATNPTGKWFPTDANYKWFVYGDFIDGCSTTGYFHKDSVIEYEGRTFAWSGSAWVETTPAPDPEPSPSA